jgi:hypothetical protein
VIVFIWIARKSNPSIQQSDLSIQQMITGFVVFASVPAIFVLMLGWVGERMSISRGFCRLSALAGLLGDAVVVCLWLGSNSYPSIQQMIIGLVVFASVPAIFVLMLGWVVAGFQREP